VKKTSWIFVAGTAVGAAVAAKTVADFRREQRVALAILRGRSQVIDTACGPIEYAAEGEGPAVLMIHGAAGGYDQGFALARLFSLDGFRLINISRPGYLRTPLASGRTPEAMADLYAALLDALNLSKAAIAGLSAGGPSSLQFALRHPDRCWGLIMLSAVNQTLPTLPPTVRLLQPVFNYSSFGTWLLNKLAWRLTVQILGVGPELLRRLEREPQKISAIHSLLEVSTTLDLRRAGIFNDIDIITELALPPVERIRAPTLVVHCPADPLVPFAQGQTLAERVPGAKLIPVEDGGHLCVVTHSEQVVRELMEFLTQHASQT